MLLNRPGMLNRGLDCFPKCEAIPCDPGVDGADPGPTNARARRDQRLPEETVVISHQSFYVILLAIRPSPPPFIAVFGAHATSQPSSRSRPSLGNTPIASEDHDASYGRGGHWEAGQLLVDCPSAHWPLASMSRSTRGIHLTAYTPWDTGCIRT